MTEERKAIVKYLRDVAELYNAPGFTNEGTAQHEAVNHVLLVCAKDIEDMHPDTMPVVE